MGEPAYYSRFGYCPDSEFELSDEYSGGLRGSGEIVCLLLEDAPKP